MFLYRFFTKRRSSLSTEESSFHAPKVGLHQPLATRSQRRPSSPIGIRKVAIEHQNFPETLVTDGFDRNAPGDPSRDNICMPMCLFCELATLGGTECVSAFKSNVLNNVVSDMFHIRVQGQGAFESAQRKQDNDMTVTASCE